MKRTLFLAVMLAAAPAGANMFEEAAAQGRVGFGVLLGSFKLPAFQKTVAAGIKMDPKAAAKAAADLSDLFDKGTKVSAADLRGWWAGRRFLSIGVAGALLAGVDVPRDVEAGPIGGAVFKTLLFPKIKLPADIDPQYLTPADYYDEPGSVAADNVSLVIREEAKDWVETKFGETGAVTKKGYDTAEIRKNGAYLIAKFEDGSFAYFFKKVR